MTNLRRSETHMEQFFFLSLSFYLGALSDIVLIFAFSYDTALLSPFSLIFTRSLGGIACIDIPLFFVLPFLAISSSLPMVALSLRIRLH